MTLTELVLRIASYIPEIKRPKVDVPTKKRLMWTFIALFIFFVMYNVDIIGIDPQFERERLITWQEVFGSALGTLTSAGIGPIVFGSLMLQLLVGAKIIELNIADPKDRVKFQGLQKFFAVLFCIGEGFIYAKSGMVPPDPALGNIGILIVGSQIALGSLILYYLDDIVGKYGIGSGISLFILGGVSYRFVRNIASRIPLIPELGLFVILPVLIAIALFIIVAYFDSVHVSIPIAFGRRGLGGRFPVKFLYVSVIPVIFASALFMNIGLFTALVKDVPYLGDAARYLAWATNNNINEQLAPTGSAGEWEIFNTTVYGYLEDLIKNAGNPLTQTLIMRTLQLVLYTILLVITCIFFAKLWLEIGGQGPKEIAEQLATAGMRIPGFRSDPRVLERLLQKYIPTIAILGAIFVALLAVIGSASLQGVATGTGILLAVSIASNFYEQLVRHNIMERYEFLKKVLK